MLVPVSLSTDTYHTELIMLWLQALNEEPGVCPEATSNMFSLLTFAWVGPLMRLGYKCAAHAQLLTHVVALCVHLEPVWLLNMNVRAYADRDAVLEGYYFLPCYSAVTPCMSARLAAWPGLPQVQSGVLRPGPAGRSPILHLQCSAPLPA